MFKNIQEFSPHILKTSRKRKTEKEMIKNLKKCRSSPSPT